MTTRNAKSSIMTLGGYFDPLNPRPEDVSMQAVARGCGVPRFARQTIIDLPVDQHMLRTGRLFVLLEPRFKRWMDSHGLGFCEVALAVLVHDAAEGFLGDRLRPIKSDADRSMEAAVLAAIVRHLIPDDALAEMVTSIALASPVVRFVDHLACAHEALLWQPGSSDWAMPGDNGSEYDIDFDARANRTITLDILARTIPAVMDRPQWIAPVGCDWLSTVRLAVYAADEPESIHADALREALR